MAISTPQRNSFFYARLEFALITSLFLLLLLFGAHVAKNYIEDCGFSIGPETPEALGCAGTEAITTIFNSPLVTNILILSFLGSVGYLLATYILKPIEQMNERYELFVKEAVHELKTPLSIIKLDSESALIDKKINSKEIISTFRSTAEEADRISDILRNLSNLMSGSNHLNMLGLNAGLAVDQAIKKLRKTMGFKVVINTRNTGDIYVRANPSALEEILFNVIKNAINYTPETGRIDISVSETDNTAKFIIKDSGIGIKEEDAAHVFLPFFRSSASSDKPGMGLGLTIVKALVEMHKGKIEIRGNKPEPGTTVIIDLPKA